MLNSIDAKSVHVRFANPIAVRLDQRIDDLLALSRLESGTPGLKFAPMELAPFFLGLAEEYRRRPHAA